MEPGDTLTVIKRNPAGEETWRYQGEVCQFNGDQLILEAYFDRNDTNFHGMPLCRGDRFVEYYYTTRWYNIFEIHAREDDHLRGWYCNIGHPARLNEHTLSYIDLALDLLVFPDGRQFVLDEDEFIALEITPQERLKARQALEALQRYFQAQPAFPPR